MGCDVAHLDLGAVAVDTLKDPTPKELADAWRALMRDEIDTHRINSLVAAIRSWPTGRLASAGRPHVVVSWQRVGGPSYVTMRSPTRPWGADRHRPPTG